MDGNNMLPEEAWEAKKETITFKIFLLPNINFFLGSINSICFIGDSCNAISILLSS